MQKKEQEYLYWLCQIPGIGAVTLNKIYEVLSSFERIYYMEETEIQIVCNLNKNICKTIVDSKKNMNKIQESYHSLVGQGIRFVTLLDSCYPARLRHVSNYPAGLYVKGKLPSEQGVSAAIVGSRKCTEYGKQVAEYIGEILSAQGIQIISGLAYGIDAAGHRGALKGDGETYAVLGSGINICYPKEHYLLYETIIKTGGIISEFPLNTAPRAGNFPMRNRLISGLADVIVVIEAKENSGSLITVEFALEQGKDIFALPGRITDPFSSGCNRLIQTGANIITSPSDIVEYLGVKTDKILKITEKNMNSLAKKDKIVYSCLDLESKCLEQIIIETGFSVSDCMSILLELELSGYVARTTGNYYVKKL